MNKAWIIDVNMGYGHQRTAYPLRHLAPEEKIINANDYEGMPLKDRQIWKSSQNFYEFISKFKKMPIVGNIVFSIFDYFQKIMNFYPKRNLSKPSFVLNKNFSLIKKGWGKNLIEKLSGAEERSFPIVSTFFTPAFMAEHFNYPGEIFCVVCDADVSRTWAPLNPQKSRIKYFCPNERTVERLKLYGVRPKNIYLTGYPLPSEITENSKEDLKHRLLNLDPKKNYSKKYCKMVENCLGPMPENSNHPLTLMFAIGGAGAQKEIATKIIKSLREKIKKKEIKIIISIGIKKDLQGYFGNDVEIISGENINEYFNNFNLALRKTDIFWTKPSELSFYTAIGLPIIIAPTIGSQEDFNEEWLLKLGSGKKQENPDYTSEWLFDDINSGWLAEAAMEGFIEAEKSGVLNIEKIISQCSGS
jgi:UDP-N-acetylglucosamine:LPS N-acetylglucosamine transferase